MSVRSSHCTSGKSQTLKTLLLLDSFFGEGAPLQNCVLGRDIRILNRPTRDLQQSGPGPALSARYLLPSPLIRLSVTSMTWIFKYDTKLVNK